MYCSKVAKVRTRPSDAALARISWTMSSPETFVLHLNIARPGVLMLTRRSPCAGNFTGAPELSRCISNRCGAFDGRVHVWDAAAREWLLPRVAALSESKKAADALRAMIKRMLAPDPEKRPTFPELLEELT